MFHHNRHRTIVKAWPPLGLSCCRSRLTVRTPSFLILRLYSGGRAGFEVSFSSPSTEFGFSLWWGLIFDVLCCLFWQPKWLSRSNSQWSGAIQCLAMLALLAAEVAPTQEFPTVRCDQVCRWLAGRQVACLGGRHAGRLAAWQAGKQAGWVAGRQTSKHRNRPGD